MSPQEQERKATAALQNTIWSAHRIADWLGMKYSDVVNLANALNISLDGRR